MLRWTPPLIATLMALDSELFDGPLELCALAAVILTTTATTATVTSRRRRMPAQTSLWVLPIEIAAAAVAAKKERGGSATFFERLKA